MEIKTKIDEMDTIRKFWVINSKDFEIYSNPEKNDKLI